MLLENMVDKGVLLGMVEEASKVCPITFDNGRVIVGKESYGVDNIDYTFAVIEDAIKSAYRQVYTKST